MKARFDPGHAHLCLLVCFSSWAGSVAFSAETVLDVNMKTKVALPRPGQWKQVSGIEVELDGRSGFTAPEQVCTLLFERGAKRLVVRVWENKDHRYFVSAKKGDDRNPGTEDKPFKTIYHGIEVMKKDPDGDLYVAGGDYHEEKNCNLRFKQSFYGGFDENGWRRDPAIHQSVLLPHGFRENWIDDMCDRFKDLRRTDHRYHETRVWPHVIDTKAAKRRYKLTGTLSAGGTRGRGKEGSPETYMDGVTVFGCADTRPYQPGFFSVTGLRTVRNCILVMFWSNGHAFLPAPGGGHAENNICWGGIVGRQGHARPQMVHRSATHYRRDLFVGATGGDYTRMFLCWGEGGIVEECHIHGGNSFGWSIAMQGHHGAMKNKKDYIFRKNLFLTEYVGHPWVAAGLVLEDNEFFVRSRGFSQLLCSRTLVVRNNTFHLSPKLTEHSFFPKGNRMTSELGGTYKGKGTAITLAEPEGEGAGKPVIENNKFIKAENLSRRPPNFVDIRKLSQLVKTHGENVTIRPKDPAKNLKVKLIGRGTVRLSWEASKDPDVAGYRVYYGPRPNSYAHTQVVRGTTAAVRGLKRGEWYFSVAAHKKAFVECWKLSNEAVVTVSE